MPGNCELYKTLVVNLLGGPGAGKSTIATGVFSDLKFKGIECELALEYAKEALWEGRYKTFEDQIYLFGKQHRRIFRLLGQVQVIITDSPILLTPIYDEEQRPTLEKLVIEEHKKMWSYNVFLKRIKKYNPRGRFQNEKDARKIDSKIVTLLDKYNLCFEVMEGSSDGKDTIIKKILMLLKWKG